MDYKLPKHAEQFASNPEIRRSTVAGTHSKAYYGSYDEGWGPPSPRSLVRHYTADLEEPLIPDLIVDAWLLIYHDRDHGHAES